MHRSVLAIAIAKFGPLLCRFLAAGNDDLTTRSGDRPLKTCTKGAFASFGLMSASVSSGQSSPSALLQPRPSPVLRPSPGIVSQGVDFARLELLRCAAYVVLSFSAYAQGNVEMSNDDWLRSWPPGQLRTNLGDIFPTPSSVPTSTLLGRHPPTTLGGLLRSAPSLTPAAPITKLGNVLARPAPIKRKVYFAFDFDDLFRVNNVRQAWKIDHPDGAGMRSFYDRSIWESRNIKDEKTLKNLMRNAVQYSSAVCVLVGTNTWKSRWVKYEIARAVIDVRGLVAVHINGLNHVKRRMPDQLGYNPLHLMGIYRSPESRYYLYEKQAVIANPSTGLLGWEWQPYEDYTDPVSLPRYIPAINSGCVMPLSAYTAEHNYVQDEGHRNIGAWIDGAAILVAR